MTTFDIIAYSLIAITIIVTYIVVRKKVGSTGRANMNAAISIPIVAYISTCFDLYAPESWFTDPVQMKKIASTIVFMALLYISISLFPWRKRECNASRAP